MTIKSLQGRRTMFAAHTLETVSQWSRSEWAEFNAPLDTI